MAVVRLGFSRMMNARFHLFGALFLSAIAAQSSLFAQQPAAQQPPAEQAPPRAGRAPRSAIESIRPTYILGVGDEITIHAPDVEEISDKPFRVNSEGNINLPVLGTIPAAGVTVDQLEMALTERLRPLVRNPQVVISVAEYRSEPVFFVGAFNSPGIYPLQGRRRLIETLAGIGGLQANASRVIKVTRRLEYGTIPLPNAVVDREAGVSSVQISLSSLTENVNPAEDIVLQPFDVIRVNPAEMVYVNGQVGHVGGLELRERDSLSVTQAISMAGGLAKDAAPEKSRILRPILNTSRRAEIPVNIKMILEGKARDFPLMPNDVLYVPQGSLLGHHLGTAALIGLPVVGTVIGLLLR
jgi:polysaccharide export outer membrane protein